MRVYRVAASLLLISSAVMVPSAVVAAENQGAECPRMQLVVVNSASDS